VAASLLGHLAHVAQVREPHQSEAVLNVYQKLNEARAKFHALELKKTGHNKFAGYNYFELGDFLIPAMKVFREVGLCAYVSFDADKACMLIRNVDKPDEYITLYSPMGSAALKGCHEVQNIGAVETYQRRYLWVAALEIVEHDALDATTGKDSLVPLLEASIAQAKAKRGVVADVTSQLPDLSPDEIDYFRDLAADVAEVFKTRGQAEAFDRIEREQLDSEQRIHLWGRLDSKIRSALKAERGLRIGAA
jgi:hypothetical protein